MTLLLALACASAPAWTDSGALAPHRAHLDSNHDGRVDEAEYEAHLWNGPPMGTADADHDGDLSTNELIALVAAQSPTHFDADPDAGEVHRAGAGLVLPEGESRDVWEVLVWMNDTLRAAGDSGLSPEAVAAAVASGHFDSGATHAALAELRPRWEARGWAWPEGLP